MEIVCTPETYRRFKSSSLRHKKKEHRLGVLFFVIFQVFEEDLRVGAANGSERFALPCKTTLCSLGKMDN